MGMAEVTSAIDKGWQQIVIDAGWIVPDWPAPGNVCAVATTKAGGISIEPFAGLNLGDHVGDNPEAVLQNRRRVRETLQLAAEPLWLEQVHGVTVCRANSEAVGTNAVGVPVADASVAFTKQQVAVVMTADCLPVLFCDRAGSRVAAAHAGWRGLCNGVLEQTVKALDGEPGQLMAWLGPAIGPEQFEVGMEVREAFMQQDVSAAKAFRPGVQEGKYLADIYQLARQRLQAIGVAPAQIYGGGFCTVSEEAQFFSYRRTPRTGRMASLIWLDSADS